MSFVRFVVEECIVNGYGGFWLVGKSRGSDRLRIIDVNPSKNVRKVSAVCEQGNPVLARRRGDRGGVGECGVLVDGLEPDRAAGREYGSADIFKFKSGRGRARSPKARPAGANVPLYSEDWTEDSGQGLAAHYSQPITDPRSLEQVRTADEQRSERGIASVLSELKAVDRQTPAGRAQATPARGLSRAPPHVDRRVRQGRPMAKRGTSGRSRLPPARASEHRGPARGRRPEARRDGKLRRLLQRVELHFPTRSRRSPPAIRPARARRSGTSRAYLEQQARGPGRPVALERGIHDSGRVPRGGAEGAIDPAGTVPVRRAVSAVWRTWPGESASSVRGANMAGGAIVDDFNGDGLLDVFYLDKRPDAGLRPVHQSRRRHVRGQLRSCGARAQVGALNCNHADYDNDGDLDILLLRGGWETPRRPSLLRNEGDGRFTDVTVAAGLCDPDRLAGRRLGRLRQRRACRPLYRRRVPDPSSPIARNRGRLYRNNGNGTFTDVADSAGVRNDRFAKGVAWGDYDNDGRPDLYVSNLHQEIGSTTTTATALSPMSPSGSA